MKRQQTPGGEKLHTSIDTRTLDNRQLSSGLDKTHRTKKLNYTTINSDKKLQFRDTET